MKPFWTAKRFWALLLGLALLAYNQIKAKAVDAELLAAGIAAIAMFIFTYDGSVALSATRKGAERRGAGVPLYPARRLTRD